MNRKKYAILNSSSGLINQLITIISGFIIPKILLIHYGSQINGLVSSITQFISYLSIVEAGLGGAAIFALYKPIANHDNSLINRILSTVKRLYEKVGIIFLLMVIVLGVIYPKLVPIDALSPLQVTILVICLGMKGIIDFFALSKYRTFLTASQQIHIIYNVMSATQVLNVAIVVTLAALKINVVIIYVFAIIPIFFRSLILSIYIKKKHPELLFNLPEEKSLLKNRWNVLYLNLVQAAQGAAPTMIATFLLGLVQVSVYTIYNIVFSGLNLLFTMLTNSLQATFGDLYAHGESEKLQKLYTSFEFLYSQIVAVVHGVSLIMILPFIKLYLSGITSSEYFIPLIGILFSVNGMFSNNRAAQGMMIFAAGHYKETRVQNTIQALLLIFFGVLFSIKYGLVGLLLGILVSNLWRSVETCLYVPKRILLISRKESVLNFMTLLVTFSFSFLLYFLINTKFVFKINNWLEWSLLGFVCLVIIGMFSLLLNLIFRRKQVKIVINYVIENQRKYRGKNNE